jgi:MoxR-like ATPase
MFPFKKNETQNGPLVLENVLQEFDKVLIDRREECKLAFSCFLSGGHLLLEDVPGTGKTSLAKCFAKLFHLNMKRIQCTNDLLPSDILGYSLYDKTINQWKFVEGPIFSELLLADELNRCSSRTQSAFLQAMEEKNVTVDGAVLPLPKRFFVIGTQNPLESVGVNKLPESQLDRFSMSLALHQPRGKTQFKILRNSLLLGQNDTEIQEKNKTNSVSNVSDTEVSEWKSQIASVYVADSVLDYLVEITDLLAQKGFLASPRSTLFMLKQCQTWAWLHGFSCVVPEFIQTMAAPVFRHRTHHSDSLGIIQSVLEQVKVPTVGVK